MTAITSLITPGMMSNIPAIIFFALPQGANSYAGWHTSKKLKVPDNITLLPLPAYSPELNPVENLWHYLRSHYWSLRVYRDYGALEEAAMAAWRAVCLEPGSVRSICAAPYVSGPA